MRCIFCRQNSADSKSVEHIMPESIGNKKRVLARGIVCDKCNNYFARKVEGPVLSHSSMRNIRALYQVANKKGKFPSLRGHIGGTSVHVGLRRDRSEKLVLEPERLSEKEILNSELEAGFPSGILFPMEMDPPKYEMSRFLCKMALETVAETFVTGEGNAEAVAELEFFDKIRTYARYGKKSSVWPYSQRRIYPEVTMMRHPKTNEWVQAGFGCCWFMNRRQETLFVFCFYGIEFVVNVGGPSIRGYEEWLEEHSNISPIVERLGCHIETVMKNNKLVHYIHGDQSNHKGIAFDKLNGYYP